MINRNFDHILTQLPKKSENQSYYYQVYNGYCVVNEYSTLPNNAGNGCRHWVSDMIKQSEEQP